MLTTCHRCDGYIPRESSRCPHCDAARRSPMRKLLHAAGGGAIAMTLMACYGAMPRRMDPAMQGPPRCKAGQVDGDGDGFCAPQDCDDTNPEIHPGATDHPGDEVDANCDGAGK